MPASIHPAVLVLGAALCLAPAPALAAEDALSLGLEAARTGDCDTALETLSKALICQKLSPMQRAAVLTARGHCLVDQEDTAGALADFTGAVELDPTNGDAWVSRAQLYRDLGAFAQALADLGKALEQDPQEAGLYEERSQVYELAWEERLITCGPGPATDGLWQESLADAQRYAQLAPHDPQGVLRLDYLEKRLRELR